MARYTDSKLLEGAIISWIDLGGLQNLWLCDIDFSWRILSRNAFEMLFAMLII